MKTNLTDLTNLIRGELGDPSTTDLPDAKIAEFVNKAIREYGRFNPRVNYYRLDLTEGVDTYAIPADQTVRNVAFAMQIELRPTSQVNSYPYGNQYQYAPQNSYTYPDISVFDNSSLATILYEKLEQWDEKFGHDWEVIEGSLVVTPTPTSSGVLAYEASIPHDLSSVPDTDEDKIMKFVVGQSLVYLGRKRNVQVVSVPTPNGTVSFNDGSSLRAEGEKYIADFYKLIGKNASVFAQG